MDRYFKFGVILMLIAFVIAVPLDCVVHASKAVYILAFILPYGIGFYLLASSVIKGGLYD